MMHIDFNSSKVSLAIENNSYLNYLLSKANIENKITKIENTARKLQQDTGDLLNSTIAIPYRYNTA
jgi:hypothetical protein